MPIKPAHFELPVLALHLIYASGQVKIRLSIQNWRASKHHCSPCIQGSWLPSPGEIPMGPVSTMELFALWPLDGSVSTQTTSNRRGSLKKTQLLALIHSCGSGGCEHFLHTANRGGRFLCFSVQETKIHVSSRRFVVLEQRHFL